VTDILDDELFSTLFDWSDEVLPAGGSGVFSSGSGAVAALESPFSVWSSTVAGVLELALCFLLLELLEGTAAVAAASAIIRAATKPARITSFRRDGSKLRSLLSLAVTVCVMQDTP
jgi:hypothetical protein